MAKPLYEVENPIIADRPVYRSPEPMHIVYKPEPTCSCGCGKAIVDGYKGSGEYFYSDECIVRVAIEEWGLKRVG